MTILAAKLKCPSEIGHFDVAWDACANHIISASMIPPWYRGSYSQEPLVWHLSSVSFTALAASTATGKVLVPSPARGPPLLVRHLTTCPHCAPDGANIIRQAPNYSITDPAPWSRRGGYLLGAGKRGETLIDLKSPSQENSARRGWDRVAAPPCGQGRASVIGCVGTRCARFDARALRLVYHDPGGRRVRQTRGQRRIGKEKDGA
ncbi:hypothetical protein GGS23DRAFT_520826 [Durotheca rogersii]|uniref:uncharacterized protein n=1 Tax=Durotheca rogersii TaxID=419775 RepID=UPI00221EC832|nr:uncharacterized protein GGS23DRAFT_520826 [Durotheca rogersii]KAI5863922.1 hypothetical protein GGS23DRAFT_520826 [Durotheca rogersii]